MRDLVAMRVALDACERAIRAGDERAAYRHLGRAIREDPRLFAAVSCGKLDNARILRYHVTECVTAQGDRPCGG